MKPGIPDAIPDVLAVWPVRHVVVFPDAVQVLRDTRPTCLEAIAKALVTMKNYNRAEDAFSRALSLKRQVFGDGHPEVGLTLYNLAYLYEQLGDAEKGSATRSEAIRIIGRDPLGD